MKNKLLKHLNKLFLNDKAVVKVFFVVLFVFLSIRSVALIYDDINITYPFNGSDSYDWIANGLYYSGYDVNFSLRPPGLPLIIAFLENIDALNYLPVLNQVVLYLFYLFSYLILRFHFSRVVSLASVLFLVINFFINNFSMYIFADIYAATLIIIGFHFYLKATDNPKKYVAASLFLASSFIFQYALVFILPALAVHFSIFRRDHLKNRFVGYSFLLASLIIFPYLIFRRVYPEMIGLKIIDHAALVKLHIDGIYFYIVHIFSTLTVPVGALLVSGIYYYFKNKPNHSKGFRSVGILFALVIILWFIFWALLYNWNDRRFLIYVIPFLLFFVAVAVEWIIFKIKRSQVIFRAILICLIVATFMWSASIEYRSFSKLDKLQLTRALSISFEAYIPDRKVGGTSIKLKPVGFNSDKDFLRNTHPVFEIKKLIKLNNDTHKSLEKKGTFNRLDIIKNDATLKNEDLCVVFDKNKIKWYLYKNKYGNYLNRKLTHFEECEAPKLKISDNGELDYAI